MEMNHIISAEENRVLLNQIVHDYTQKIKIPQNNCSL